MIEYIPIYNDSEYLALCKTYWNLKGTSFINRWFKRNRIKALEAALTEYDKKLNRTIL